MSQDMHQYIIIIIIHQHFICEQCMAVPSLIVNFDEIWSSKFKELSNLVSELQNKSITNIMKSEEAFKELSDHVDASFSNQLIALEQKFVISSPRPSFETNRFHELNAAAHGSGSKYYSTRHILQHICTK
jgi:hypothetical protein